MVGFHPPQFVGGEVSCALHSLTNKLRASENTVVVCVSSVSLD